MVTKNYIYGPTPYDSLDFLIWEHQIINRPYRQPSDINATSVFADFVFQLSNQNTERFNFLCSIIGFALHRYRSETNLEAIIFCDEILNFQPDGGNGKTLLVKILGKYRILVIKDGKNFTTKKDFAWNNVNENIDIVLIDDMPGNVKFEDYFSILSNGFSINEKYKSEYYLPFEKSPLMIFTTNNIIKGNSSSYKRRQFNVEIGHFFNSENTPLKVYGHTFFQDWDDEEWAKIDYFIFSCVKYYLSCGVIPIPETESAKKDTIRATSEEFYYWMEDVKSDFRNFVSTKNAKSKYLEESGLKNLNLSDKKFLAWIKIFCEINGHVFNEYRTSDTRGFYVQLNTNSDASNVV